MRLRLTEKNLEIIFASVFSALAFILFFALVSANGLILGNDSAVHLARAEMFLQDGKISLGAIAWYPPLYHIVLAALIAFTGATSIEQMLFLMKTLTALIDVLLLFSVYLLAARFFSKRYGVIAMALMLLALPLYEINFWGGYTSILSMAYMCLVFLYLAVVRKGFGPVLMIFVLAFSLVLSHQFATFLTAIILPPFIVVMLVKSRGHLSKVWIAAILGGGLAFFLYYFQAIAANIDVLIPHLFFDIKTMLYEVPAVSFSSFLVDFGFELFPALVPESVCSLASLSVLPLRVAFALSMVHLFHVASDGDFRGGFFLLHNRPVLYFLQ
jgi:hypothetical protein